MNCLKCPQCGSTRFAVEFQVDGQLRTEFPRGDGFTCARCHCVITDEKGRAATKPEELVSVIKAVADHEEVRQHIAFWKWKVELMQRVLNHSAMGGEAESAVYYNLDSQTLRDEFDAGKTVDQVFTEVDEEFNKWGW